MKKLLKIMLRVLGTCILIIILILGWIMSTKPNVGHPEDMSIEITPERLERGEYLANHVMLCMDCHGQRDFSLFSGPPIPGTEGADRKSTRLNSSHVAISYAVFCLKKKKN